MYLCYASLLRHAKASQRYLSCTMLWCTLPTRHTLPSPFWRTTRARIHALGGSPGSSSTFRRTWAATFAETQDDNREPSRGDERRGEERSRGVEGGQSTRRAQVERAHRSTPLPAGSYGSDAGDKTTNGAEAYSSACRHDSRRRNNIEQETENYKQARRLKTTSNRGGYSFSRQILVRTCMH